MAARVRCRCHGDPRCRLCGGRGFYEYEPGPGGWLPFRCPTCEGAREVAGGDGRTVPCVTCDRTGAVDPAKPPFAPGWRGHVRGAWKFMFGGG